MRAAIQVLCRPMPTSFTRRGAGANRPRARELLTWRASERQRRNKSASLDRDGPCWRQKRIKLHRTSVPSPMSERGCSSFASDALGSRPGRGFAFSGLSGGRLPQCRHMHARAHMRQQQEGEVVVPFDPTRRPSAATRAQSRASRALPTAPFTTNRRPLTPFGSIRRTPAAYNYPSGSMGIGTGRSNPASGRSRAVAARKRRLPS